MKYSLSKLRNLPTFAFSMTTDKNGKEEIEKNSAGYTGEVIQSKGTDRTKEIMIGAAK